MGFEHPELFLLLLPGAWAWWRTRCGQPLADGLRALALLALAAALAGPYLARAATGRDLVIVVDRSRSMPDGSLDSVRELIQLAETERGEGDRVAVVGFGARATLERALSETAELAGFERSVDPDGSALSEALELALELIPEGRPGALLVLSDGEAKGRDPLPAARRAFGRDVRIDVRTFPRAGRSDLAVERLELPELAARGEPFQFSGWVRTDARVEAEYVLERGDLRLTRGRRVFEVGLNRLVFRDRVDRAGVARYRLRILHDEDRVPENDRATAAIAIEGERSVLVVNDAGDEDALVAALRAAQVAVTVSAPESAPLDRDALEAFRAVVLENVAADRLPGRLEDLRRFVLERGGGLMLTGGQASFGIGGYYLSPVDELLPVSMEMRKEQRKQGMALAIALDRSGSMAAEVQGGGTKMDLANLGASAAIGLLSPIDSTAVIAVDSSPHLIQELTPVEDKAPILSRVRRIESMGGGIYVRTALVAAARELEEAEQKTRHIVLFADAADSEEQDGCPELVEDLARAGVTLSVIALGTEGDSDAGFLKQIAALGGGEAYFTTSPEDLPRLFAQDTLTMSRTTFVEEETAVRTLPDLFGLGEMPEGPFPVLSGYNLTWLRSGALAGAITEDEYLAPVFAFAYRGLGRTAAFTGQIGGTFGGPLLAWPAFDDFFVTVARWLVGQEEPEALFATMRREGREAVVRVEVDPEATPAPDTSALTAALGLEDGTSAELPLERISEHRYQARFPLAREGVALGSVRVDARTSLRLPPVALPYSPEFEPSGDPERGERMMRRLARESGGAVEPAASELFRGERAGRSWRPLSRELLLLALVVLLIEIAGRRLGLFESLAALARRGRRASEAAGEETPPTGRPRRRARPAAAAPGGETARPAAPGPVREEPRPSLADALERAREAAGRELGR